MVFSSLVFIFLFFIGVMLIYYAVPKRFKNLVIFLSGVIFYAWGEPLYILVMLGSTLIDYCAGLLIWKFDKNIVVKRISLIVSILMNLGLLGVFKYGGFVIDNVNNIFATAFDNPNLPLPIGISFFTFQSMSYTIDMYLGKIKVQKNPITFAAFVNLFPQLVAGPIVRYDDIARELDDRKIDLDCIYSGIIRFITGMGKKVLLANSVGMLWDTVIASDLGNASLLTVWLGIIAYTLQIYFDFSGYSDMAIGIGRMMGFNFPENFNYPYLSKSVSEFWRRWHMTLGAWFRSYVYIPLGGNRKGKGRTIFNLAVVWAATGIWHGANWTFIVWGTLYGVVIILEKLFLGKVLEKLPSFVGHIYTMLLVMLGWVLFASPNIGTAGAYIATMFGASGILIDNTAIYLLINYGFILVFGIFAATDLWKRIVEKLSVKLPTFTNYITPFAKTAVFLICIAYLADATYNPFLYFNF
ncbi:MAG: MBOAT family O-acyltransferase [Ruminiclostridium sp.]